MITIPINVINVNPPKNEGLVEDVDCVEVVDSPVDSVTITVTESEI